MRAPAPHGVELRRGVEARLVRLHDPDQPVAIEVAVALEPVVVAGDPRLLRRVADGEAPGPGQQRRLDARGHRRVLIGDVVEEAARAPQRRVPEDRVADEAVGGGGGEQRLEFAAGARGVEVPPRDRREARVPVPLPRVVAGARRGVAEVHPVGADALTPAVRQHPPAERADRARVDLSRGRHRSRAGRSGSRLHCDHEPGNNRPGPSPARSMASRL